MQQIAKPDKIKYIEGKENNQGTITIEPFYPGYGTTLGNSIRRIMLSSLTGYAVTEVKVKGVNHEFTTLPNIKEDVLEIILNLKQLCLKVSSDEEIKLELDVTGKKEVTAKDIKTDSRVDIINKDLVIANITDVAGSLSLEIIVKVGRGYSMVGQRDEDSKSTDAEIIEVDAIYSPVLSVGIEIENVRVGKMTDWDKLVFDVVTDGTITPKEAFDESVKILLDQLNSLVEVDSKVKTKAKKKKTVKKVDIDDKKEMKEKKAVKKAKTTKTKTAKAKKAETKAKKEVKKKDKKAKAVKAKKTDTEVKKETKAKKTTAKKETKKKDKK